MTLAIGVDACGSGRLCVGRRAGRTEFFAEVKAVEGVVASAMLADAVAIDVPIGLPDGPEERACDVEARKMLPGRTSTVFRVPCRAALKTSSSSEARAASLAVTGKSIPKQAWAIAAGIKAVDEALGAAWLRERVFEVHPELCFRAMNGGSPVADSKRRPAGRAARRTLVGLAFGDVVGDVFNRVRSAGAAEDDVLGAFAALWTAERIVRGEASSLTPEERDSRELPMRMVY